MNKKAFTLAEMLITLGIIGVIAAITIPALVAQRPCENKINLLRAYNTLSRAVTDIASDETLYYGNNGLSDNRAPIGTQPAPADVLTTSPASTANNKFSRLIASRINIVNGSFSTNGTRSTFTTTDGIEWTITNSQPSFNVTFDVPGDENLTHEFAFVVDEYGGINPSSDTEKDLIASPTELSVSEFKKITGD